MKILITGYNGFLGRHLIRKLKCFKEQYDIDYLSVGGTHLSNLGIKSIYDLKEITYIGFTSVIFNLFKIKKKIDETVKKIIEYRKYNPPNHCIDDLHKIDP